MLCGIVEKIEKAASKLYSYIDFGRVINFSEVKDESVVLTFAEDKEIYGIELKGSSNRKVTAKLDYLFKHINNKPNVEILLNIIKTEKESFVFVYSNDYETIKTLRGALAVKKIMSGKEIVESFAYYFMFYDYDIKYNVLRNLNNEVVQNATENMQFHTVAEFAIKRFLKENDVYQMVTKTYKKLDIYELFQKEWRGVLSIYIDPTRQGKEYYFKEKYDFSNRFDKEMKSILGEIKNDNKAYNELMENTVVINAIFVGDETSMSAISSLTGMRFVENYLDGVDVYKQTLLKRRDNAFNYYVEYEDIEQYFGYCKKEIQQVEFKNPDEWYIPDYYGKDFAGNFINHTFAKNTNTHTLIVGETGSGKTSSTLHILENAMLFDKNYKSKLFETGRTKLRYFDIDNSAGGFIEKIRDSYPQDSLIYSTNVEHLRFNILDLETDAAGNPLNAAKNYAIQFINVVLSANNKKDALRSDEMGQLSETISRIYRDKEKYLPDLSINELIKEGRTGYEELYQELLSKGYSELTKIKDLPEEYDFLKKPTLEDVISLLESQKENRNITSIQRETIASLLTKLESVKQLGLFSFLANVNFKDDKKLFYIDLTEVKKIKPLFISIVWLMISEWIKKDKDEYFKRKAKGLPKQKIFYVIEESHNFLGVDEFEKIFSDLAKEVRKFGIHFIFLVHTIADINQSIYKSVATKIFFFTEGNHDVVKREINQYDRLTEEKEAVFNQVGRNERGWGYVSHSYGEDACKFEIPEDRLQIYKAKKL